MQRSCPDKIFIGEGKRVEKGRRAGVRSSCSCTVSSTCAQLSKPRHSCILREVYWRSPPGGWRLSPWEPAGVVEGGRVQGRRGGAEAALDYGNEAVVSQPPRSRQTGDARPIGLPGRGRIFEGWGSR